MAGRFRYQRPRNFYISPKGQVKFWPEIIHGKLDKKTPPLTFFLAKGGAANLLVNSICDMQNLQTIGVWPSTV